MKAVGPWEAETELGVAPLEAQGLSLLWLSV